MGFSHLSRWLWGKKERGTTTNTERAASSLGSPLNYVSSNAPVPDGAKAVEYLQEKGTLRSCSPLDGECLKWQSDGWEIDNEYDLIMVPNDVRRLSDADEIDWSVGWFEPHSPKFLSDCETEKSFAVLVPCYRPGAGRAMGNAKAGIPGVVAVYEDNKYLDEFLSSLQSS